VKYQINKILLIQPPYTIRRGIPKNCQIPLGLGYLAATLKDEYEVKIIDAIAEGYEREESLGRYFRYGLSFSEIREKIKSFSPDLIGISCLFSTQWENARCVAQIAKEIDKEIVVVEMNDGQYADIIEKELLRRVKRVSILGGDINLEDVKSKL